MRTKEYIQELLGYMQSEPERALDFDVDSITAAYERNSDHQSLPIKVLSVFGGILACFAFMGFLYLAGLYHNEIGLLIFGFLLIAAAIGINIKYDKIIMDTISVASFVIGFILLGLGLIMLEINENLICLIFIAVALISLSIVRNYILSFIAVLIVNGSVLALIIFNHHYDLIHLYVSVLALIISYFFLNEARLIKTSKALNMLYYPIRTGLMFSLLSGLICLGKRGILPISPDYIWLSSIIFIGAIVYMVSIIMDTLNVTKVWHKVLIYMCCILILLPTAFSPAISGAIFILLFSFRSNYKLGIVVGIIAFVYFISQYYYDLNLTLLTKSILMFSSGILFIIFYLFIHKKLTTNEKV